MHKTIADFGAAVDALGLPWTNLVWPHNDVPPMPYVVLVPGDERGVTADNDAGYTYRSYTVELYYDGEDGREMALEKSLKAALKAAGIPCGRAAGPQQVYGSHALVSYLPTTLIEQEA